jgi:hypothetical protein
MEEIFSLLGDYGVVALLFAWFIYQFFKDKAKSDTLKNVNKDRKTDTDEVARQLNNEQEVCLAVIKEKIFNYEKNHFPTIDRRFERNDEDHKKLFEIMTRMETKMDMLLKK